MALVALMLFAAQWAMAYNYTFVTALTGTVSPGTFS